MIKIVDKLETDGEEQKVWVMHEEKMFVSTEDDA